MMIEGRVEIITAFCIRARSSFSLETNNPRLRRRTVSNFQFTNKFAINIEHKIASAAQLANCILLRICGPKLRSTNKTSYSLFNELAQ